MRRRTVKAWPWLLLVLAACAKGPGDAELRAQMVLVEEAGGTIDDVAYGAGVFVATTPYRLLVSQDGERWWAVRAPARMNGVVYTERGFLAVGNAGVLMTSPDGRRWQVHRVGQEWDLFGAAYGNGLYLLLAGTNTVLYSRDLRRWRVLELRAKPELTLLGAAYGRGRFVVSADVFRAVVLEERRE